MVGLILIVKLHGGRCVVQRSEQVLLHVPDWAAVLCKALQHKFDVVGVQLHKPATHYLGRAVIPGNPQHLSLGRTGIHQQINNLVDNILIIWAKPEKKLDLQGLRKIFFKLFALAHPVGFFRIEGISLIHLSIILISLITSWFCRVLTCAFEASRFVIFTILESCF